MVWKAGVSRCKQVQAFARGKQLLGRSVSGWWMTKPIGRLKLAVNSTHFLEAAVQWFGKQG